MRIEQARFVKASPEQVFQAWTDYEAWPRFSAFTQVRVAERAGDVVYLDTKLRVMGRETKRREKVTLTPPQLIRVEGKTVGATNTTIWKFEPAPGGTQVTGIVEAKLTGLMKALGPLAKRQLQSVLDDWIEGFARYVEAR